MSEKSPSETRCAKRGAKGGAHSHPPGGREKSWAVKRLTECRLGQRAVIAQVGGKEAGLVQYLANLGIMPEVEVVVEKVAPLGGALLVKVGRSRYLLGRQVAEDITIKVEDA